MNVAATAMMKELPDINCAYGNSDEFRFDAGHGLFSPTLIVYLASYSTGQADYSKGERGKWVDSCDVRRLDLIISIQQNPDYGGVHFYIVLCSSMAQLLRRQAAVASHAIF